MKLISNLLPKEAASLLRKAALDPQYNDDPLGRRRAVDNAIDTVKRRFPQYFRDAA